MTGENCRFEGTRICHSGMITLSGMHFARVVTSNRARFRSTSTNFSECSPISSSTSTFVCFLDIGRCDAATTWNVSIETYGQESMEPMMMTVTTTTQVTPRARGKQNMRAINLVGGET